MGVLPQDELRGKLMRMELADFPRQLSLSLVLSPRAALIDTGICPTMWTLAGKQLDSIYLVLLALNEECRATGQGAFYHLPLRSDGHEAHPCDLIYLPDEWNMHDMVSWDKASWAGRLEMSAMAGRIEVNEDVLPICARVLRFDHNLAGSTTSFNGQDRSDSGYGSHPGTSSSTGSSPTLNATDTSTSHTQQASSQAPTTQYDPAICSNTYRYSRPMEDISTYLILYTSHRSTPVLCPTAAFEHHSLCERLLTPGDFSETFSYGPDHQKAAIAIEDTSEEPKNTRQDTDRLAAQYVMSSGMSSNRELVEHMWTIWHEEKKANPKKDWLGRVKYSWQEVKSIIDEGRLGPRGLPRGWPNSEDDVRDEGGLGSSIAITASNISCCAMDAVTAVK